MKDCIFVEIKVPEIEDIKSRMDKAVDEIRKCYEELMTLTAVIKKEPEDKN